MHRRPRFYRSFTKNQTALSVREFQFHPVTYVCGSTKTIELPHIGKWSGHLPSCRGAPNISCCYQSAVIIVFSGGLARVAHPQHGGLVARCTVCFRAVTSNSNSSSDPAITRHRTPLVARLGQALASAYHGLDPDPMWLGPLNATTFLSVVDDLIWTFLDGNLRHGFPLIDDCAPAARCEMPVRRARRRHLPLNLFFVRKRELG